MPCHQVVEVKVAVFNYLTEASTVLLTLEPSADYEIVGAVNATLDVEAGGPGGVSFFIRAVTLGQVPIIVRARSDRQADAAQQLLRVKAEGLPQESSSSVFLQLEGEEKGATASATFSLDVNFNEVFAVPGSVRVVISTTADLMGPSIQGLDSLIRLPSGCGEQNMITFAPVVAVAYYLENTKQFTAEAKTNALRYMMTGYQRELTYRRVDHGYSAFGNSDPASSVWLTAFVVKTLAASSHFIAIDTAVQSESGRFIAGQQNKDGSFNEPGRVIHQDMQGEAGAGLALTVYVTTALIEAGLEPDIVTKGVAHIEQRLDSVQDVYTTVLAAYCLTLANSPRAGDAVRMMNALAHTNDGLTHWTKTKAAETAEEAAADAIPMWRMYQLQPSTDVEMTGYALLVHIARGDVGAGLGAARWLVQNRNGGGGFHSTQDTVVALVALAAYAEATFSNSGELTVTLAQEASAFAHEFFLNAANFGVLQRVTVPTAVGGTIEGTVTGTGAVLVQAVVSWNELADIVELPPIVVQSQYDPVGAVGAAGSAGAATLRHVVCARMRPDLPAIGMSILKQELFSGFAPDIASLDAAVAAHPALKRYDVDDRAVHLYLDWLDAEDVCVTFVAVRQFVVADLQTVTAEAYDYYEPSVRATVALASGKDLAIDVLAGSNDGPDASGRGTCLGGVIQGGSGGRCKCADAKNCQACSVDSPAMCSKCRKRKVLLDGACVTADACPATHAHVGAGKYGQECRLPHTCIGGRDETGRACSCSAVNRCAGDCSVAAGRNKVTCNLCSSGFLVNGRCKAQARCIDGQMEGSDTSETCSCNIPGDGSRDCLSCLLDKDGGAQCLACRNGKYFHGGECLTACPDHLAPIHTGSSPYNRVCLAPLSCTKGEISTLGHARQGAACRCLSSKYCQSCEFVLARNVTPGSLCTRCKKKYFLHDNTCLPRCPALLAHAGIKQYGRVCAEPFTCTARKHDVSKEPCECPKACRSCDVLAGNSPGTAKCTSCFSSAFLHREACVTTCPKGTIGTKTDTGNVCV